MGKCHPLWSSSRPKVTTSNSSFIIQTMVRKMFVLYKRNVVGNTKNNTLHGGCLISLNINCSRDWANGSQEKSSKQCICAQHINLNEVLLQWKKKADKRTEKKGSEKRCYTAGNGKRNKSVTEERVPDSIVVSYDAEKVAKLDWGGPLAGFWILLTQRNFFIRKNFWFYLPKKFFASSRRPNFFSRKSAILVWWYLWKFASWEYIKFVFDDPPLTRKSLVLWFQIVL